MRTLGIVSHIYKTDSVVFSVEKLLKQPFYINSILPIGCKVIIEFDTNNNNCQLIYQGLDVNDSSDDDYLLKLLFELDEVSGLNISDIDPFERTDLTSLFVATIDPLGSKDLDDAVSIKKDKLYIHIADVLSYFLDKPEMLEECIIPRANTYYFSKSNIPMIPRNLSDDKISLIPGSEKRAITLEFDTETLELLAYYPSKIVNNVQLTYEEVDKIISGEESDISEVNKLVSLLRDVYNKLKTKAKINLNLQSESHKIIEELMILANNAVAKILPDTIYRYHSEPYTNKAGYLQRFIGCQLNKRIGVTLEDIIFYSDKVPQTRTVAHLTKHMMSKAVYTNIHKSHWALNLDYYTHFTSPIRRASDIIVHSDLLTNSDLSNKQNLIEYINQGEEKQKTIETIIDELKLRRGLTQGKFYPACVIKVLKTEVEYFIPDLNFCYSFHISECSSGEYLQYSREKGGELKSQNYSYTLGKCNSLRLDDCNIKTGKIKFSIIDDNVDPQLL